MQQTVKILIADDSPEIHDIMEWLFVPNPETSIAPQILHAANGQEALQCLAQHPDTDAIVLDLNMPVMDGFAVLSAIREDCRLKSIPVCVFSACLQDSTLALKLGARDLVAKPGDFQEIRLRVLNLVDSKKQIEASQRAKLDFLSTVSHELRTPMNGVIGMSQLLRTTDLSDEQSEYLTPLEKSAESMMRLVDNILGYLGSEYPLHNLPLIPFSVSKLFLDETERQLPCAAANNTRVNCSICPSLPDSLLGLPEQLREIFHQLLENSIKFSPSGEVLVRLEPGREESESIELCCTIEDTGIGIVTELQSCIYEPFFQADSSMTRPFGGLGIGLSIANRLLLQMGGMLTLDSEPGKGSRFSFRVSCATINTQNADGDGHA